MAAVMAMSSGRASRLLDHGLAERGGVAARLEARADVVEPLDLVVLGRGVPPTLLREHVDHDRAVELRGVAQRPLDALDVVAVERAGVADAEVLEERGRLEDLAHGGDDAVDAALELVAHHRHLADEPIEAGAVAEVGGVQAEPGQAVAELRHGGGVRPAVVVEHDDGPLARVPEVVQPLEGHAAGERAVADHRDDPAALAVLVLLGDGEPVGVADHRRGVAVLDPVVLGLGAGRVAGEATGLAQRGEVGGPAREHLVDVGLVAGVPEDDVAGESNTRCRARVSSTAPRFEPRCPCPVCSTESTISVPQLRASWSSCEGSSERRSAGPVIESRSMGGGGIPTGARATGPVGVQR